MSNPLDKLNVEERRDWRVLEQRLKQEQSLGSISVSQRELAEIFKVSPATARRRIKAFVKQGLIQYTVSGKGRTAKTQIDLVEYQLSDPIEKGKDFLLSPAVGILPLDSPLYLQRDADHKCREVFQSHRSARAFIRLKGTRHSGKSSLLIRLGYWLEQEQGHCVGRVDLNSNAFRPESFDNLEQLLYDFTYAVATAFKSDLRKPKRPDLQTVWRSDLSPTLNCDNYLANHIFGQIPEPATLLIDGLDQILGREQTQTPFCNFLRSWNEQKMKDVGLGPLIWPNIVMAYSTEPYPAYGIIGSVFQNVGIPIILSELTQEQVAQLVALYELQNWDQDQFDALMQIVGGHPALIQEALYYFYQDRTLKITDLLGPRLGYDFFQNHLLEKMKLLQLEKPSSLLDCFRTILSGQGCYDEYSKFQLEKGGVIKVKEGQVDVLALYRQYFTKVLETMAPTRANTHAEAED